MVCLCWVLFFYIRFRFHPTKSYGTNTFASVQQFSLQLAGTISPQKIPIPQSSVGVMAAVADWPAIQHIGCVMRCLFRTV